MPNRTATVYVANLPWRTTEDDLLVLFEGLGAVLDVRIIQDPATGRSRGYGFVELADAEHAARAVENLNGAKLRGRPLVVGFARPRPPRH